MSIFAWYMTKKFMRPFFFGLGLFALLIFLGDMFDKMRYLIKSPASLWIIMQYLWLEVPYWTVRTIPMATLLATLVAITDFTQSGEWLAVQSCGFETKFFWKPLLWCALAVTAFSFVAQETVLPACFYRARQLWQDHINPEWERDKHFDIALVAGPDQFISAKLFLPKAGRMERPVLDHVGADGVAYQLDAKSAYWDAMAGHWVFLDGVSRDFSSGSVTEKTFKRQESDFKVSPRNMVPKPNNPDEMSLRQLRHYIRRMNQMGVPVDSLRVAAYSKLAYPFTNLIICALGIPVALRLRRSSKVLSFCVALVLSFFYLWVMELGKAFGTGDWVHPAAAAWSANVVFAAVAVWLIRRWEI